MEDLEIHQMDIVAAFLGGDLEEEIYMEQPEGFEQKDGLVCLLRRSLYGPKQAPRIRNKKLHEYLIKIGFMQSTLDHCLYIKEGIYLAVWVDDLILIGRSMDAITEIKRRLGNEFEMKDLGELKNFLGIHVTRDRTARVLTIDQEAYTNTILERFNMQDSKPVSHVSVSGVVRALDSSSTRSIAPISIDVSGVSYLCGILVRSTQLISAEALGVSSLCRT